MDGLQHIVLFPVYDQVEPFEPYNECSSKAESEILFTRSYKHYYCLDI